MTDQKWLGHAKIVMTLDLYSHVTADMQRHAADVLDVTLSRAEAS
jgi:integrase